MFFHIFIDLFELVFVLQTNQEHLILDVVCELVLHIETLKVIVEHLLQLVSKLFFPDPWKPDLGQRSV